MASFLLSKNNKKHPRRVLLPGPSSPCGEKSPGLMHFTCPSCWSWENTRFHTWCWKLRQTDGSPGTDTWSRGCLACNLALDRRWGLGSTSSRLEGRRRFPKTGQFVPVDLPSRDWGSCGCCAWRCWAPSRGEMTRHTPDWLSLDSATGRSRGYLHHRTKKFCRPSGTRWWWPARCAQAGPRSRTLLGFAGLNRP